MFSRKFFAWVGVGVLSVATIPTFAAPHLAKLASRKPAAATVTKVTPAGKTAAGKAAPKTATKAPVKVAGKSSKTPAAHKSAAAPVKKTGTVKLASSHATPAKKATPKTARHKSVS